MNSKPAINNAPPIGDYHLVKHNSAVEGEPIIYPGDRVRDPLDGEYRTVSNVENMTVYMTDGGAMGLRECTDILLPSERIPV